MSVGEVREQASRPHRADPPFDLYASKLHPPLVRPGTLPRPSLVERLARDDSAPIVSVIAPAGYGKTTLLAQWAERSGQVFAWVSAEERDNDPKVLLSYIAAALNAVEPIDERVFDALASPASSVPGSVVPRLGSAFAAMTSPVVLVLDDVHILHNAECRSALSLLADHVPEGSRLALAGRAAPPLRLARLRTEGRLLEIGPADLSLTHEEASALLRDAGAVLGPGEVAELHRRTEGWAAGLYLAALYLRERGSARQTASFGGDDRLVSEYLDSEFLAQIPRQQRASLILTAVLDRMCEPLCVAVLGLDGARVNLADLARSNLLVVPLDRRGEWYRYHHLFRDMLLAELERREPGLAPVLRRRAASWCRHNGLPEEALEYAMAAGDVDTAADLVAELSVPTYRQGRRTTPLQWFRWLDDHGGIETHPMAAVQAAIVSAATGRAADAERWADVVDRWQRGDKAPAGDPTTEAWAALLRCFFCRHGVEQMQVDADEAIRGFAAQNIQEPGAMLYQGLARLCCGDLDGGGASFQDAVGIGEQTGTHDEVLAIALCELSLLMMARRQWQQAQALADRAEAVMRRTKLEEGIVYAVLARIAVHRADATSARQQLISAQGPRSELTYAQVVVGVQVRIELTRVHIALADTAGARALMREVDDLLKRAPGLGTLVGEAEALRDRLAKERGSTVPGASALTTAELRLLPWLSTYLTVPEIASELYLSSHTIKSQAMSIYRKLGASTRSQAVTRSRELGLLEG